jgi:hypothetical protein
MGREEWVSKHEYKNPIRRAALNQILCATVNVHIKARQRDSETARQLWGKSAKIEREFRRKRGETRPILRGFNRNRTDIMYRAIGAASQ